MPYINWEDGMADMHNNAYLLEEIINWVNKEKFSSPNKEKNVVLGQSMGGVIARYALRNMELKGENHDTRLYISHDAPHQGANIPEGIIALAEEVASGIPQLYINLAEQRSMRNKTVKMLEANGSKQLLKSISWKSGLYQDWYTELQQMGYPKQSRNIAISNGSGCGQKQDINFGGVVAYGSTTTKKGGFDFTCNVSPNKGKKNQTMYLRIYQRTRVFNMTDTRILYSSKQTTTASYSYLDTYAGGKYDFPLKEDWMKYVPFNFVSVSSALDVGEGKYSLDESDYERSYSILNNPQGRNYVPFDNFYTVKTESSRANTQHISFTKEMGTWLIKELDQAPALDCSFICTNTNIPIDGPTFICDSGIFTTKKMGDHIKWEIDSDQFGNHKNSLVDMTLINDSTIKLAAKDKNKNGYISIQLKQYSENCGSRVLIKRLWVGKPSLEGLPQVFSNGNSSEAVIPQFFRDEMGITDIKWKVTQANRLGYGNIFSTISDNNLKISGLGNNWEAIVEVTVTNSCGSATKKFLMKKGQGGEAQDYNSIIGIIGKPLPNEYEVVKMVKEIEGSLEQLSLSDKVEVSIFDLNGRLLQTSKEAVINIDSFPAGAYIFNAVVNDNEKATLKVYKK